MIVTKENNSKLQDSNIRTEVFNDFEQLVAMKAQWDDFTESEGCEIFLSFDWCRIWWKYYGVERDLNVFVFREGNKIVGIMPLFFENIRLGPFVIRAAKIVGSDFTLSQFSMAVKSEYVKPVMQALYASMSARKWDVLYLGPIAGAYRDYEKIIDVITRLFVNSKCTVVRQQHIQTYYDVTDNWDNYISSLSKNERKKIRKYYKTIAEISQPFETCMTGKENFSKHFNEFVMMHQSHWMKLGKAGHFGDWPYAEKFHRQLAETNLELGRLRLLKFSIGGECLGYKYYYKYGDRYYLFLDARRDKDDVKGISWGRIMFCEVIKKAIDENVRLMDSMRGKYEHKLHLGGKLLPIKAIYVVPQRKSSMLKMRLVQMIAKIINICYYKIWYCRVVPVFPSVAKPLWKTWIRINAFS